MVHFATQGNKIYVSKGREGKDSIDHCYNNEACACRFNLFVLHNRLTEEEPMSGINSRTLNLL